MDNQKVTILIPNYKTLKLTQLCLRLIRKHTELSLAKVIVIDNDSRDDSTVYLRSLKWIELIERPHIPGELPALSHSRALDKGLEKVTTPYVLVMHTDSLVRNQQWLPFLLSKIESAANLAGVGSWKLESKPLWKNMFKTLENFSQRIYFSFARKKHAIEGIDDNHYYLRSHCALYRTDLIRRYGLGFSDCEEPAGKALHRVLVEKGHKMLFLPSSILLKYMDHINHATTILNPQLSRSEKSVVKGMKRIQKSLASFRADEILKDASLDY